VRHSGTSEVAGKISFILIAFFLYAAGCATSHSSTNTAAVRIDTPEGMINYLQKRGLPALKSVEVWENEYGPGVKLTTAHYEIYTTLLEPLMLSQVPGFMESAYRGYQSQLPGPIETNSRFTVYLYADRQQWEAFTIVFSGYQAQMYLQIKAGAYYLKGACVAYNIGLERTFAGLGHEGWHQFNSRLFQYRLPSWLDEGLAMQYEVSREEKGFFVFDSSRNGYRLGDLKKTLTENKMIPLEGLVSMNPGEAVMDSNDAVTAFYGQAYALVRFLREEDYGKRLVNFQRLMQDGLDGSWPLSDAGRKIAFDRNIPMIIPWNRAMGTLLFKHYIDKDFDKIEKEYVAFCRKIVYNVQLRN